MRLAASAAIVAFLALASTAPAAFAVASGDNGPLVASFTLAGQDAPAGNLVAFPATGGNPSPLAGSPALPPGTSAADVQDPAWSADGTLLAYTLHYVTGDPKTGEQHFAVQVAQSDGTGATTLVDDATEPSFSPDGSQVAVTMLGTAPGSFRGIALVDLGDGTVHPLVPGDATHPSWSPFGDEVAYVADGELRAVAFDGSSTRDIEPGAVGRADWSPDGTQIAFAYDPPGPQQSAIGVIDAFGGDVTQISPPGVEANDPAWSPDGTLIAYAAPEQETWGDGADPHTAVRLFAVPTAGGGPVLLDPHFAGEPGPSPVYGAPTWQPTFASIDDTFDDTTDDTGDTTTNDTSSSPTHRRARVIVRARAGRFGVLRLRDGVLRVPCRVSGDLHARCGVKATWRHDLIGVGHSRYPGAHQVVLVRLTPLGRFLFAHEHRAKISLVFTPIVAVATPSR